MSLFERIAVVLWRLMVTVVALVTSSSMQIASRHVAFILAARKVVANL